MLFGKLRRILSSNKITYNYNRPFISLRHIPRHYGWFNVLLFTINKSESLVAMSRSLKFRLFLRDLSITRLMSVWTRSYPLSSVVKRCRRDRGVREVIQSVRQTFFRSKRTILLSAAAAYKHDEEDEETEVPCQTNITDDELEALVSDLETVDELSRVTLYCTSCARRLAIDKRYPGIRYCSCKVATAESDSHDGWVPYMEADDVIIWRKEYKSGQRYAYKVYGRYPEVLASDFAAVQVDSCYRKSWDAAVASLSTVEDAANGVRDQVVLHWEVMWPRLFSNRDYVYIRRFKQFNAAQEHLEHKDHLFKYEEKKTKVHAVAERPSVHSNAKRKAIESEKMERCSSQNKVFVIISRSCVHDRVPESKNVVRVRDYWSNMVVKSLHGSDRPGAEFVLTYYDDAGGGGLPGGVSAWATGRAAPAYLATMRAAALHYHPSQPIFDTETETAPTEPEHLATKSRDQSTQTESTALTLTQDKKTEKIIAVTQTPTQTQPISKIEPEISYSQLEADIDITSTSDVKTVDRPQEIESKEVEADISKMEQAEQTPSESSKEVDEAKEVAVAIKKEVILAVSEKSHEEREEEDDSKQEILKSEDTCDSEDDDKNGKERDREHEIIVEYEDEIRIYSH